MGFGPLGWKVSVRALVAAVASDALVSSRVAGLVRGLWVVPQPHEHTRKQMYAAWRGISVWELSAL